MNCIGKAVWIANLSMGASCLLQHDNQLVQVDGAIPI
jgi:hypothetical protein